MKHSSIKSRAYFDCNATTPVLPSAVDAALETMNTLYGNPSSTHLVGLQAKHLLESTRKKAAQVVGAEPDQIVFTSGATEAIQTAVLSALSFLKNQLMRTNSNSPSLILYGATEHKAVPQALQHWIRALSLPYQFEALPVDSLGKVRIKQLNSKLPDLALLCTMAVNNETGVIQDLEEIESLLIKNESQCLWLVDCVQALGKIKLQLNHRRIDYATFSGHKLYAPKGIGFLYVKRDAPFTPLIAGGGQEKGLRSGTENLPGVAALGAVLDELLLPADQGAFHSLDQLQCFQHTILQELKRAFPKLELNTPLESSVPTTLNFSIPGLSSSELVDLFDSAGLRVSAGSACNSAKLQPSYVLEAMGLPEWRCSSAVRLSFGLHTSEQEIMRGCQIIRESALALKKSCLLDIKENFIPPSHLKDGILQFRVGSTNCWMITDQETRRCLVIDPFEAISERIVNYIQCQNLEVLAILDTHSHADHDSVRPVLKRLLKQQMNTSNTVTDSLGWPCHSSNLIPSIKAEKNFFLSAIKIKSISSSENLILAKLPTPGHTGDSHTFLLGKSKNFELSQLDVQFVFSGDTVLGGGLGRTNFLMSDSQSLFYSLKKLQSIIHSRTLICPAHDYTQSFATSLQTEIQENPLLALALGPENPESLSLFMKQKEEIDLKLANLETTFNEVVCGVTQLEEYPPKDNVTIDYQSLEKQLKTSHYSFLLIDVREPQEFSLFKDWSFFGFTSPPRNVPLSRFVNFMGELLQQQNLNQVIYLICRSGSRSLQAAKALRRLGFENTWSVEGGLASLTGI